MKEDFYGRKLLVENIDFYWSYKKIAQKFCQFLGQLFLPKLQFAFEIFTGKIKKRKIFRMLASRHTITQVRNSSGKLKELGIRLKSIRNIEKITKTMKMISSAKFAKVTPIYPTLPIYPQCLTNTVPNFGHFDKIIHFRPQRQLDPPALLVKVPKPSVL